MYVGQSRVGRLGLETVLYQTQSCLYCYSPGRRRKNTTRANMLATAMTETTASSTLAEALLLEI
jgi:hypothetical protein